MKLLTEDQKERIKRAIKEAEKKTSGEIVPYIVHYSDFYWEAHFKSALFFNLLALVSFFTFYQFQNFGIISKWSKWDEYLTIPLVILFTFIMTFIGLLICYIPFIKRLFAGRKLIEERVNSRAKEAFLEREVFLTKNRTGILIFISFLEHRVVVLGDSGINQRVSYEQWKEVVNYVIEGIKNNDLASGIEKAIQRCGELLQESGLAIEINDINELSDEITEKDN
jgi:putative membrane protein